MGKRKKRRRVRKRRPAKRCAACGARPQKLQTRLGVRVCASCCYGLSDFKFQSALEEMQRIEKAGASVGERGE